MFHRKIKDSVSLNFVEEEFHFQKQEKMRRDRKDTPLYDANETKRQEEIKALKSSYSSVQQTEKDLVAEIKKLEAIEEKLLKDQEKLKHAIHQNS